MAVIYSFPADVMSYELLYSIINEDKVSLTLCFCEAHTGFSFHVKLTMENHFAFASTQLGDSRSSFRKAPPNMMHIILKIKRKIKLVTLHRGHDTYLVNSNSYAKRKKASYILGIKIIMNCSKILLELSLEITSINHENYQNISILIPF